MKIISTSNAPAAIGPYSQAILVNGMLYTSGQIPLDPFNGQVVEGGIKEQTLQVMKNLKAILDEAGTSFENVIKTTCFLYDMVTLWHLMKFMAVFTKSQHVLVLL